LNRLHSIKRLFSRDIGKINEDLALKFLQNNGLQLIGANFNCRYGELDLIMRESDVLVFVEVKYRRSKSFGGALSAVTSAKQRKLVRTALWYMQQNGLSNHPARFDVVAIDGDDIQWFKNAFYASCD
jgi:putative endonuclease